MHIGRRPLGLLSLPFPLPFPISDKEVLGGRREARVWERVLDRAAEGRGLSEKLDDVTARLKTVLSGWGTNLRPGAPALQPLPTLPSGSAFPLPPGPFPAPRPLCART